MTGSALALVLGSAVVHATWNLAAKKSNGGIAYVFMVAVCGTVFWSPLGIWLMLSGRAIAPEGSVVTAIIHIAGSSVLHMAYFASLQKGYQCGDLSLVYPLARGTGPLVSSILAIILYGERPSIQAFMGALLIAGGAFFLASGGEAGNGIDAAPGSERTAAGQTTASRPHPAAAGHAVAGHAAAGHAVAGHAAAGHAAAGQGAAIYYGLLTGVFIAAYTLWDKRALSLGGVSPLFLEWGTCLGRFIMMAPWFLLTPARRASLAEAWRDQRKPAMIVGALSPVSYMMVLSALAVSPVTYVAPTREISILLGTLAGSQLLLEGDHRSRVRRCTAAAAMALGVAALAIW